MNCGIGTGLIALQTLCIFDLSQQVAESHRCGNHRTRRRRTEYAGLPDSTNSVRARIPRQPFSGLRMPQDRISCVA